MKFSFAIAGYSLPDLETGKTMNQGDIIAYKPSGWQWGKEEVKRFLIVEMDVENEQEAARLCSPQYDTDKYVDEMTEEEEKAVKIIGKRRHKLDIIKLGIDTKKLEDITLEYQPLKEISKVVVINTIIKEVIDGK